MPWFPFLDTGQHNLFLHFTFKQSQQRLTTKQLNCLWFSEVNYHVLSGLTTIKMEEAAQGLNKSTVSDTQSVHVS